MRIVSLVFMLFATLAHAQSSAEIEELINARLAEPVTVGNQGGFWGVAVDVTGKPIAYIKEGLGNLISEPQEWTSRNWGRTLLLGTATYFVANPDSGQDLIDALRGKDEDEEATVEQDDSTSVVIEGDGNTYEGESKDHVVIRGDNNSVTDADGEQEKDEK